MPHAKLITVFAILDPDDKQIKTVCSSRALADEASPTFDDFHGHGSATVVERQAIELDGKVYLLAQDFGPEVVLDKSQAVDDARLRISGRNKLTDTERTALKIK